MRAENPGKAGVRPAVLDGAERERERERCVSDADASSYGTITARNDPHHTCPYRTHANTTPHHPDPVPLPYFPCYERSSQPLEDRPKPSLISVPPTPGTPLLINIYTKRRLMQARTENRRKTASSWRASERGRDKHGDRARPDRPPQALVTSAIPVHDRVALLG